EQWRNDMEIHLLCAPLAFTHKYNVLTPAYRDDIGLRSASPTAPDHLWLERQSAVNALAEDPGASKLLPSGLADKGTQAGLDFCEHAVGLIGDLGFAWSQEAEIEAVERIGQVIAPLL